MKALTFGVLAGSFFLGGCVIYTRPPEVAAEIPRPDQLQIKNDQIDTEPRTYFDNGVDSRTTHYRGYTEVLIHKLRTKLKDVDVYEAGKKSLTLSIQSITCKGFYVADCTISVAIGSGDGYRRLVSSPTRNGSVESALEKAMNDAVDAMAADPKVIAYLVK